MKPKVVITGGAGFIGSHIVEECLKRGYEVTVIDNLSTGKIENIQPWMEQIRFVEGDILNIKLLEKEITKDSFVIHQAAVVSVPESIEYPEGTNDINIRGTINVFQAAISSGAKRVVYASSASVYGDTVRLPASENAAVDPKSPYAEQKYSMELYAKIFSTLQKLETVGLRYFNVYGERQALKGGYPAAIPIFINKLLKKEPITIFGDGETTRDFIYVKDIARANVAALTAPEASGKVFNVAAGKETSLNELLKLLSSILELQPEVKYEAGRAGDIKRSLADVSLAEKVLGFKAETDLVDGLKSTINFYR